MSWFAKQRGELGGRVRKMTEDELQNSFGDFNSRYFGGLLACKVTVTDDWIDAEGNYYPDSVVQMDADSLFIRGQFPCDSSIGPGDLLFADACALCAEVSAAYVATSILLSMLRAAE